MMHSSRTPRPMNKVGRRTNDWQTAWKWLKPKLKAAHRTSCEFGFMAHECGGPLDPVHSRKRREMQGDDLFAVAIGCRNIHEILDGLHAYPPLKRRITHSEMEKFVLKAINKNGGLILPDA